MSAHVRKSAELPYKIGYHYDTTFLNALALHLGS